MPSMARPPYHCDRHYVISPWHYLPIFSEEKTENAPHSATGHYEAHETNHIRQDNSAHGSAPLCQIAKSIRGSGAVARQGSDGTRKSVASTCKACPAARLIRCQRSISTRRQANRLARRNHRRLWRRSYRTRQTAYLGFDALKPKTRRANPQRNAEYPFCRHAGPPLMMGNSRACNAGPAGRPRL